MGTMDKAFRIEHIRAGGMYSRFILKGNLPTPEFLRPLDVHGEESTRFGQNGSASSPGGLVQPDQIQNIQKKFQDRLLGTRLKSGVEPIHGFLNHCELAGVSKEAEWALLRIAIHRVLLSDAEILARTYRIRLHEYKSEKSEIVAD